MYGKVLRHGIAGFVPRDHVVGLVVARLGDAGVNKVNRRRRRRFWGEDVLDAPGSVQGIHTRRLWPKRAKVKMSGGLTSRVEGRRMARRRSSFVNGFGSRPTKPQSR